MHPPLKIGTRESQLAVWQAKHVQSLLQRNGIRSEIIFIKSEGDMDTTTPLYELGIQGIFTRTLDSAVLDKKIDIAVHSMKDVPTQPTSGIRLAAVLKRDSFKDILVFKGERKLITNELNSPFTIHDSPFPIPHSRFPIARSPLTIATCSLRRKAQWLHRYPDHCIENLRGNVDTRLLKLSEQNWDGAIFAAAGLERIGLRPENSIDLDWMLPDPAQGAITISCRTDDDFSSRSCRLLNDADTESCTKEERNFLHALLGGCSTSISALAVIENDQMIFKGNICSTDGKQIFEVGKVAPVSSSQGLGLRAAFDLLEDKVAQNILFDLHHACK